MATKLDKTLRREIEIDGQAYTIALSPDGVKLTQKGFRKGREMSWRALWSGASEEGSAQSGGMGAGMGGGMGGGIGEMSAADRSRSGADQTPPHGDTLGGTRSGGY